MELVGLAFSGCLSVGKSPLKEVDFHKSYFDEFLNYLGINQTLSVRSNLNYYNLSFQAF